MNTPLPSRWPELFDMAMAIIDQANAQGIGMNSWSFGGGTALMLQINHRESHDIDLFIEDAQYLPYLNPETQDYDLALAPSDYETDGLREDEPGLLRGAGVDGRNIPCTQGDGGAKQGQQERSFIRE